jgi:hypothetical protein
MSKKSVSAGARASDGDIATASERPAIGGFSVVSGMVRTFPEYHDREDTDRFLLRGVDFCRRSTGWTAKAQVNFF